MSMYIEYFIHYSSAISRHNLLVGCPFVLSGGFRGSIMTLKDSTGENLQLQTLSLSSIHLATKAPRPLLHFLYTPVPSPPLALSVDFVHITI